MRVLRSTASAVVSLVLLIGVPWLLTTTIGNPLRWWPDLLAGDVSNQVVLAALAAVLWLAWAQFAVAGPKARAALELALPGHDFCDAALPFMGCREIEIEGMPPWRRAAMSGTTHIAAAARMARIQEPPQS